MYKLFNLIIDEMTGFDIKSGMEEILRMETWSRNQIKEDQKSKFRKLSVTASKSIYYKNYSNKDLRDFPIIERGDLQLSFKDLCTNIRKPYSIQHTSGSTGAPVSLIVSKEMLLAKRIAHQKMLHWFDLSRESSEMKLGGPRQNFKTHAYYLLKNKRFISSFSISGGESLKFLKKFNRFRPKILYGYPSVIHTLLRVAQMSEMKLHRPQIVVFHAENLHKETTHLIEEVFPSASVVNQFWATEANIAVTCPEGKIHIDEDTVICEVVDEDKNGVGDLLVTNLYSYDLPIIRYRIGDRVKFDERDCSCGRKTKVIERIEGRKIDYIEHNDGSKISITGSTFSNISENVMTYQLVHHKKEELLEFRYVPLNWEQKVEEEKIAAYMREYFILSARITKVREIPYTSGGKFKKLVILE